MAQIVKSLSLDVSRQNRIQAIVAKQYDKDSRYLTVQLTDEGTPITVESSSVVTINASRADSSSKAFEGEVNEDGTVTVPITYWMLELDDKVTCDISVVDAQGRKLSTLNFTIEVDHANYSGDDISEDENYDLLVTLLAEVAEANEAEEARVSAENDRVTAENVRQQNEQQRQQSFKIPYIAYSSSADGSNFTTDWTEGQNYIGIATAQEEPENPADYIWTRIADLVNVVQEEGNSTSDAMSQKAVTDALRKNTHHYTARWDKTLAQLTRTGSAAGITTNTENFGHFGSVNPDYDNPFDDIYPWSGIKLCNINIETYQALSPGESVTKCVTAWEGDPDFSYTDTNGVWRYRPEFWGCWSPGNYYTVSDQPGARLIHYPEAITGRWSGSTVTRTINGEPTTCLLPLVNNIPQTSTVLSTLHTYAKNYGATLDSVYSIDADVLLFVVEYATMNSQNAIGMGVTDLILQGNYHFVENATESTQVKILKSEAGDDVIQGAIFDIGAVEGGSALARTVVISTSDDPDNANNLIVTLSSAVTVTTSDFWSIHGLRTLADSGVGSRSGYIGTNGKSHVYYRGMEMYGNVLLYTLGAYENHEDQHIWIAQNDTQADRYDTLDTSVHMDTGLVLPSSSGYINALGRPPLSNLLTIPPFCTETGGNSSNPVGDSMTNRVGSTDTVLCCGGYCSSGYGAGIFYGYWYIASSATGWMIGARPRLKNPSTGSAYVNGTTLIF